MTMEDDSVVQATIARRERLKALRAAKEYADMPDAHEDDNSNYSKAVCASDGFKANAYETRKTETFEEDLVEQGASASNKLLSKPDDGLNNGNGKFGSTEEDEKNKEPNMKFRNYLPHDKLLQEGKLTPVVLPKFEDPVATSQQPSQKLEKDPFVNIAPKKPYWDLARDVQKKLDKLERRTQKALYELMLEQEKEKAAILLENARNED